MAGRWWYPSATPRPAISSSPTRLCGLSKVWLVFASKKKTSKNRALYCMDVSINSGIPKSSILNRVFHYKPSVYYYSLIYFLSYLLIQKTQVLSVVFNKERTSTFRYKLFFLQGTPKTVDLWLWEFQLEQISELQQMAHGDIRSLVAPSPSPASPLSPGKISKGQTKPWGALVRRMLLLAWYFANLQGMVISSVHSRAGLQQLDIVVPNGIFDTHDSAWRQGCQEQFRTCHGKGYIPGTLNNHVFMDVWWNNHFLYKDLESSNWNNH